MKKKTSSLPDSSENHLHQFTDDHPLMQWLETNGKSLLVLLGVCLVLLFVIYRFVSGNNTQAQSDYIESVKQYALFQKNGDLEALKILDNILLARPELHAKYDGLLAQKLLNLGEVQKAETYAKPMFARLQEKDIQGYEEFSSISLLISQENYKEALAKSQQLKQKLLSDATSLGEKRNFGDFLFAYNLLRTAMLESKAGTPEKEREAWSEWKTYAKASANSASIKAASFYTLSSLFEEGAVTLDTYIHSRAEVVH